MWMLENVQQTPLRTVDAPNDELTRKSHLALNVRFRPVAETMAGNRNP